MSKTETILHETQTGFRCDSLVKSEDTKKENVKCPPNVELKNYYRNISKPEILITNKNIHTSDNNEVFVASKELKRSFQELKKPVLAGSHQGKIHRPSRAEIFKKGR